jgi:hypothetical protein
VSRLTAIADLNNGDIMPESWVDAVRVDLNYSMVAGAALASGTTLTITAAFHSVTGVANIDTITDSLGQVTGQSVFLVFAAAATVRNNGGGTGNIRTRSGLSHITVAGEVMELVYDGSHWIQVTSQLMQDASGNAVLPGDLLTSGGTLAFSGLYAAYNPVMGASVTPPTPGTGAVSLGRYTQIGKIVHYRGLWAIGAGGPINVGSGTYRIPLPVAANTAIADARLGGSVHAVDASGNAYAAILGAKLDGTNSGYFVIGDENTPAGGLQTELVIDTTHPSAGFWSTNGGSIRWSIQYEAA